MCILFSPQVPSSHREQDFTEQTATAERKRKRKKKNTEEKEGVEAEDNVKSLSTPKLKKRKVQQDGGRDSVAANSLPPTKVKKQKRKRKHKKVSSSETAAKLSSARLKSYGL